MISKHKIMLLAAATGALVGITTISFATGNGSQFFVDTKFSHGVLKSREDKGPAKVVVQVQQRVIQIFEADYESGNLKPNIQKLIGKGKDDVALDKLKKDLETIWSPRAAQKNLDGIVRMFDEENGQGLDLTFKTVNYIVDEWQGVQVDGDVATAQFIGHAKITHEDSTSELEDEQWVVNLELVGNKWLMDSRSGVRIAKD
jgi:hypothetical protein